MNKKKCGNEKEKKILDLLSNNKPLILEIREECCGDSYFTETIIRKIENEFNNNIRIARIDYKTYKNLLPDVEVQNFPIVALIKDRKISKVINGNMSRSNLKELANDLLSSDLTIEEKNITKK